MGRATIVSEYGEGEYQIEIDVSKDLQTQKLSELDRILAELATETATLETALADAGSAVFTATGGLDVAIADGDGDLIRAASDALLKSQATRSEIDARLNYVRIRQAQTQAERDAVAAIPVIQSRRVWCTTLTEEALGDVGTIEINGEPPQVLIVPECNPWTTADGQVYSPLLVTPEAAYLNMALAPGWQRHKPTYRLGTLTGIDRPNDTGDVRLDAVSSSIQNLPINEVDALTGVPIQYLTCNSSAFEFGDRVVVEFEGQDWSNPKVIGFEDNPRACGPYELAFVLTAVGGGLGSALAWGPAMYLGFADTDINTAGNPAISVSPFVLPPRGVGDLDPRAEDVFAIEILPGTVTIHFDTALIRETKDQEHFDPNSTFGLREATHGRSFTSAYSNAGIYSVSLWARGSTTARIQTFEDTRSVETVQNDENESITIAIGNTTNTIYSVHTAAGGTFDPDAYAALYETHYTPPQTITIVTPEGAELDYQAVRAGPLPDLQNPSGTFFEFMEGDTQIQSVAYRHRHWIVYRRVGG